MNEHGRCTTAGTRPNRQSEQTTVLVTGFSSFHAKFPVNPSFEITKSLPEWLPSAASDASRIRIIAYPEPIRVCYEDVRELVPRIHECYRDTVDLVLHIGMAGEKDPYCIERVAHRDGYTSKADVDGKLPAADEGRVCFGDCPQEMTTSLDFPSTLERWRHRIQCLGEDSPASGARVCPSDDPGRFLCDYLYFNSLAWFGRNNHCREGSDPAARPVLFLHVPAEASQRIVDRGREVTTALIEAMVETWRLGMEQPERSEQRWTA